MSDQETRRNGEYCRDSQWVVARTTGAILQCWNKCDARKSRRTTHIGVVSKGAASGEDIVASSANGTNEMLDAAEVVPDPSPPWQVTVYMSSFANGACQCLSRASKSLEVSFDASVTRRPVNRLCDGNRTICLGSEDSHQVARLQSPD